VDNNPDVRDIDAYPKGIGANECVEVGLDGPPKAVEKILSVKGGEPSVVERYVDPVMSQARLYLLPDLPRRHKDECLTPQRSCMVDEVSDDRVALCVGARLMANQGDVRAVHADQKDSGIGRAERCEDALLRLFTRCCSKGE